MKVTIREAAEDDLDRIFAWIAKDKPRAAAAMASRIRERINRLELDPLAHMGRPGFVEGTREFVEYHCVIVYKVFEERREVLVPSIFHGAQDHEGRER
jgi:plasmid stabilization system protein ParE